MVLLERRSLLPCSLLVNTSLALVIGVIVSASSRVAGGGGGVRGGGSTVGLGGGTVGGLRCTIGTSGGGGGTSEQVQSQEVDCH